MDSKPSPARERILHTAHDLFYRNGIRATGIDRIIAESGVAKVTFYRHFPSKNDLILAYLDFRHRRWMDWFEAALLRHGGTIAAIVPSLAEWFADPEFRGCAFINGVGEMAGELPEVTARTRRHKEEMNEAIAALLPPGKRKKIGEAIGLAVDGTIIRAQFGSSPEPPLAALDRIIASLQG